MSSARLPGLPQLYALLLLLSVRSVLSQNASSTELDIIYPRQGSYNNFTTLGFAVVIAPQNPSAANPYNWTFSWRTDSLDRRTSYGSPVLGDTGTISFPNNDALSAVLASGPDLYVALGHPYFPSGSLPWGPMLPGRYTFSWNFQIGATCDFTDNSQAYQALTWVANGSFVVTAAANAPYPELTGTTSCASFLAAVSYGVTTTYPPIFSVPSADPLGCLVTSSATESSEPCRATLDVAYAASVSSILGWTGTPGTNLPQATASEKSGASRVGLPLVACYLISVSLAAFSLLP